MREPKLIGSDERVPCALTRRERDLITERTFIGPDLEARLRLGVVSGRRLVVNLTLDDVDELAGYVAAEANHCDDSKVQRVLDAVHDRLAKLENEYTDERPVRKESKPRVMPFVSRFTPKQGQYLAFIYYYTKIHGTAPAEADLARYFRVSAPAVHQMIVTLTNRGLITRTPGRGRSIRLEVLRSELPDLE